MRKTRARSLFFFPTVEAKAVAWQPLVDIYRAPQGWVIKMDLAGVRPQDVAVSVRGSQLTVSGVRRDWVIEAGWSHYTMEIAYDRFTRAIELPCDLERATMTVECREGMLLVRVVCKEETQNV